MQPSARSPSRGCRSIPVAAGCLLTALSLGALTTRATAQVLHVPQQHTTIQAAIDAAAPGSTIIVNGGSYDAITIDKRLTIVGDPAPFIDNSDVPDIPFNWDQAPCVKLAGNGYGTVRLINVTTGGQYFGNWANPGEGIAGGGFDALHVLHSTIDAGIPNNDEAVVPAAGIDVDLPYLLVADSTVHGGRDNAYWDQSWSGYDGAPGIRTTGTLTLLDSEVTGGDADDWWFDAFFTGCPPDCGAIVGGRGGDGVVADTLHIANSTVTGGSGGSFTCDWDPNPPVFICSQDDGSPLVVSSPSADHLFEFADDLSAVGPALAGGTWTLSWDVADPTAWLVLSAVATPPLVVGAKGTLFMDPDYALLLPVPGDAVALPISVPVDPALLGLALTFQVYGPTHGLTRPVVAAYLQ